MEAIKGYERDNLDQMAHMMTITLQAHSMEFCDFLGDIAGERQLLNEQNGQFFTPAPLSQLMAQMAMQDAETLIEKQGIITIADPAVGAGATLIATAKALHDQGIDPRSCAQYDAIDISREAFNMAYIQLTAQGLQAMVRHGNTLSLEMWEHRPTPQLRYFDQDLRRYQAIEGMRQLLTDAEVLLGGDASEVVEVAQAAPDDDDRGKKGQLNLIDTTDFTGDSTPTSKPQRQSADIVLPEERQLGLFSNENDG